MTPSGHWGSGAFTDRSYYVPLATALSPDFTVITYDRRGRGDSTDTAPYAVEREIEDLAALREATGAIYASADSSGVMVLLRAGAAGVPFDKLAVMEPPFRVEGAPPAPDRYLERLQEFINQRFERGLAQVAVILHLLQRGNEGIFADLGQLGGSVQHVQLRISQIQCSLLCLRRLLPGRYHKYPPVRFLSLSHPALIGLVPACLL